MYMWHGAKSSWLMRSHWDAYATMKNVTFGLLHFIYSVYTVYLDRNPKVKSKTKKSNNRYYSKTRCLVKCNTSNYINVVPFHWPKWD